MQFIRRRFSRPAARSLSTPQDNPPVALFLGGDGRLSAIKSTEGFAWGLRSQSSVSLDYFLANAYEYARAAVASVWAHSCINLRADSIARLQFYVRDRKTQDIIDEHPLTIALYRARQNIIRKLEHTQLVFGETFIRPLLNEHGYHSDLWMLANLDTEVETGLGYISEFRYNPEGARAQRIYRPEELCFIYTDNDFDDWRGLSKFESCLLEIRIDQQISRTTFNFYKNDAKPGLLLILNQTLTTQQKEELMAYWNAQFQGPEKAGRVGLLPNVIQEVKEFQRSPSIDDVELRESTRREICAAFKVPLSLAGAWDDATYQSLPEQRKAFYEETIIPEAESLSRDLTKKLLPFFDDSTRHEVWFDPSTILALVANRVEAVDIATKKLSSGAYSLNEMRKALDDDPIPGGDIHIMQSGWIPVRADELATYDAPNTAEPESEIPLLPAQTSAPRVIYNGMQVNGVPEYDDKQSYRSGMVIEPPFPVAFGTIHDGINIGGDEPLLPPTHISEQVRAALQYDHDHDTPDATYNIIDTQAIKSIHDDALHELQQWRKHHKNKNKRPFENRLIRDDIAEPLREALKTADSPTARTLFDEAQAAVAIKAVEVTRSNFELEIKTLIDGAATGDIERRAFTQRLKQALYDFGSAAYRDGLTDGGVITPPDEPLDSEDNGSIEILYSEHAPFAADFAEQIYNNRLSAAQLALKPRQWWGKSMLPFYDGGLLSAAKNQMVEYVGPVDANSCESCKALVGQRHRRRTFADAGLLPPYGRNIICGDGGLCKHRVIATNSRPRGSLSAVPKR